LHSRRASHQTHRADAFTPLAQESGYRARIKLLMRNISMGPTICGVSRRSSVTKPVPRWTRFTRCWAPWRQRQKSSDGIELLSLSQSCPAPETKGLFDSNDQQLAANW